MRLRNILWGGLGLLAMSVVSSKVAYAETVVVVSARSDVPVVTKEQVADIFLGRSTRFPDGKIATPMDQPVSAPVRDDFYTNVVGKNAAQAKAHWAKLAFTGKGMPPKEAKDLAELKKMVSQTPGAVSYLDRADIDDTLKIVYQP